jgi:hypothetical protein
MPFLDWVNKNQAQEASREVPYHLLKQEAVYGESAENLLIQGDNLLALKALIPFYAGRVKCIFIDPPYNTQSAFTHYDDKLEHSQWLSMSDVNVAIGEFGQQKMDDLQRDARNEAGLLRNMLLKLEKLCLDQEGNQVNAFLIRSDDSRERAIVQILSDLRMVHLIHQSITPRKAGERFEAYILDYSLFTGFRRRPNIKEMIPKELQFKAAELRALPKVSAGFFTDVAVEEGS